MNKNKFIYWLLIGVILLAGCSNGSVTEEVTDPGIPGSLVPTDLPIDTPTPLAPVGVLLTPEGSDQQLAAELNSIIGGYIRDQGLRFQVLVNLTAEDFERDEYEIVVVLSPYPGVSDLAESFPDTKFLAVGFNDLEPSDNLSILRSGGGEFDVQGFIAGYIAAMITPDWRVGALSVQENEDALAARDGFRVGVKYYCGLCNPKYAPTGINYLYPKFIDLPQDASDSDIIANIDYLVDRAVNTFYIVPGVGTQSIYRSLVGYQKLIIGSGSDYREEYRDFWIITLKYDLLLALNEVWPLFLSAETGFVESPPLLLTDINYDLLSEGKLMLVEKILEEVTSGFIQTNFEE